MAKNFKNVVSGSNRAHDLPKTLSSLIRGNNNKNERVIVWLETDKVYSNPQVRTVFPQEEIEELAATMQGRKQQSAIKVYPADEEGRYCIYFGERRWRAARLNNEPVLTEIDPTLSKEITTRNRIVGQLVENIARNDLVPLDLARALQDLRDDGMSVNEIALSLGKKAPFISKHLKLIGMPDDVTALLKENIVTYIETLNILSDIYHLDREVALTTIHKAREEGGLGRPDAKVVLDKLKNQKKNADITDNSSADNTNIDDTHSSSINEPATTVSDSPEQPVVESPIFVPTESHSEQTMTIACDDHSTAGSDTEPPVFVPADAPLDTQTTTTHTDSNEQQHDAAPQPVIDVEMSWTPFDNDNPVSTKPISKTMIIVLIEGEKWELLTDTSHLSVDDDGDTIVFCRSIKDDLIAGFPVSDCVLHSVANR